MIFGLGEDIYKLYLAKSSRRLGVLGLNGPVCLNEDSHTVLKEMEQKIVKEREHAHVIDWWS